MKKIPTKNYLLVALISLATIFLVFYLIEWHNTTIEYQKNNSVLSKVLTELKANEIENYLVDNPHALIYAASSKDETIKKFENQFKKMIEDEEIFEKMLYLDTSKEENNDFYKIIKKISKNEIDTVYTPNLFYFEGNEIVAILYKKETTITKNAAYTFLIKNGIIIND